MWGLGWGARGDEKADLSETTWLSTRRTLMYRNDLGFLDGQGLHCLPVHLHLLDSLLYGNTALFVF